MSFSAPDCERILGERFYGFGHWGARYWFIGPEQGQDASENNNLDARCQAFVELERDGLCDCREFHERVGLPATLQWYQPIRNGKIQVQNTWRRLMKIVHYYESDSTPSANDFLKYQCERLGRVGDKTCLLELSGLPARNGGVERDRRTYREPRMRHMVSAMQSKGPEFVVIYRDKANWDLWKSEIKATGGVAVGDQLWRLGETRVAFKTLPNAQNDRELINLARSLRVA
jgi:hypothetical protein